MMGTRIFFSIVIFLFLLSSYSSAVVNTRDIDEVRSKGVLEDRDFKIINKFVDEAVQALVTAKDFSEIARIRTTILTRRNSDRPSAQGQYTQQFFESAQKYISSGLVEASKLPEDRKLVVTINLLILIDGLEDLRLIDLAMGKLKDKNTVIRYWAVHCVTNPAIIKQLNTGKTSHLQLTRVIVEELKRLVEISSPEIISLIARFAAGVNVPQAEDLLLQVADMRMKKYVEWTVEYELLDAEILKLLCAKLTSGGQSNSAIARRFGQLYSYALQRYIKGKDYLNDVQKQWLVSTLVETEDKCISKLLGRSHTVIKRAIEQNDETALKQAHNRLLGDKISAGELPLKLKFDYGAASGIKSTSPLELPEPPN